jgi:aminoglycoside phosphotransferase family enzyme/predicted kinase
MNPEGIEFDIRELLQAAAFPHPTVAIALRETHISWVILTGPYAYKIKKPVKADFIDATTLSLRRFYCEEELRLNGRLAPEIYLDVVPITRVQGRLTVGGTGPAIEYAVRMRQFPAEEELPALLTTHAVSVTDIASLGTLLAGFHLSLPAAAWQGSFDATAKMLETVFGNLGQLNADLERAASAAHLGRLIDWTGHTAEALEGHFQQRERTGFIRECHGDLHAANIVRIAGRLVPFDCIEFDPGLRWIDVINDVAFLFMDLVSRDRPDLAFTLLSRYLEKTGDYEGVRVLPFYAVYRALVRAKVDAYAAVQMPARAAEFQQRLRQRLRTAARLTDPPQPALVIMHGVSGSGKSWMSERLVPALAALRIRSDLERKRMTGALGRSAQSEVGQGIYTPNLSHRVYAHLADSAEICLRAGFSIIVDATFLDAADRELFQGIAARLRVGYLIVACQADAAVLTKRIEERTRLGHDPSDATTSVLAEQLGSIRPFTSREQPHVISVDTRDGNAVQSVKARLHRFL